MPAQQVLVAGYGGVDHFRQVDLSDKVVLFGVLAPGIIEGLFGVAGDTFQLGQKLPGPFAAVVFAQQLARRDGGLDLMDPLLDVLFVFHPFPLDCTDLFQHRLFGHPHQLAIDFFFGGGGRRQDFGQKIAFVQLFGQGQQSLQPPLLERKPAPQPEGQHYGPDPCNEGDRPSGNAARQQKESQCHRTADIEQNGGKLVPPERPGPHRVYPCRCLVLMKPSSPMPASFSRMRATWTLRALSSM